MAPSNNQSKKKKPNLSISKKRSRSPSSGSDDSSRKNNGRRYYRNHSRREFSSTSSNSDTKVYESEVKNIQRMTALFWPQASPTEQALMLEVAVRDLHEEKIAKSQLRHSGFDLSNFDPLSQEALRRATLGVHHGSSVPSTTPWTEMKTLIPQTPLPAWVQNLSSRVPAPSGSNPTAPSSSGPAVVSAIAPPLMSWFPVPPRSTS